MSESNVRARGESSSRDRQVTRVVYHGDVYRQWDVATREAHEQIARMHQDALVMIRQLCEQAQRCILSAPNRSNPTDRYGNEGHRTVTTTESSVARQEWSVPGPQTR
ncbi:hypothetical protein GCM10025762_31460 [Haloechinothrix salitolerans]